MAFLTEYKDKYKRIHLATEDDNGAILKFFRTIAMDTEALQLRYERLPNYFAFIGQQGVPSVTFLFKNDDDSVGGLATITTRHAWVNGELVLIGYNGDLRVSPQLNPRTRVQWRKMYGEIVDKYQSYEELGCPEYQYAVIMDGNRDAIRALVKPNAKPAYHKIADFNSINIFGQICRPVCNYLNKKRIDSSGYDFSWATSDDFDDLKCFLYKENKDKQLGTGYTAEGYGELERRIDVWNSFTLNSFLIVRKGGAIVSCFAPWSNGDTRRIVIEKAPVALRVLGRVMPFLGEKTITVNSELKTLYLTSLEIDSSLTQEKRSLLLGLMVDYLFMSAKYRDYNLISIFNSANCSFSEAVQGKGYVYTTQGAALYQVLSPAELKAGRLLKVAENEIIGFELAVS